MGSVKVLHVSDARDLLLQVNYPFLHLSTTLPQIYFLRFVHYYVYVLEAAVPPVGA